jgi:hypothetical protein
MVVIIVVGNVILRNNKKVPEKPSVDLTNLIVTGRNSWHFHASVGILPELKIESLRKSRSNLSPIFRESGSHSRHSHAGVENLKRLSFIILKKISQF